MKNIESLLSTPQAENIFRIHRIPLRGMKGVRQGFEMRGSHFMMELVKAVSPGSVLNGNYGGADEMGSPTYDQWITEQASTGTGKGWDFWAKTLTLIGQTGVTVKGFKDNVLGGGVQPADIQDQQTQKKTNTIIYVVAAVIIVVVGILLFYKKK